MLIVLFLVKRNSVCEIYSLFQTDFKEPNFSYFILNSFCSLCTNQPKYSRQLCDNVHIYIMSRCMYCTLHKCATDMCVISVKTTTSYEHNVKSHGFVKRANNSKNTS